MPQTVKFGLRTTCVASANTHGFMDDRNFMLFGVNPVETLKFYSIGHELTHFIQAIANIPSGEKQCDMWTIARSELFLDKPPRYIDIPISIRKDWDSYKSKVRGLCIEAIEIRKNKVRYIQWMEGKVCFLN